MVTLAFIADIKDAFDSCGVREEKATSVLAFLLYCGAK